MAHGGDAAGEPTHIFDPLGRLNLLKIKAIEQIEAPKRIKDVRRITGCVAAMSRFISKSAERALPFLRS